MSVFFTPLETEDERISCLVDQPFVSRLYTLLSSNFINETCTSACMFMHEHACVSVYSDDCTHKNITRMVITVKPELPGKSLTIHLDNQSV